MPDLNRKIGPVPVWGLLALGGLGLVYWYYRKQQAASASTTQGALSVPTVPLSAQSSTQNLPQEVTQSAGMPYSINGPDVYLNVNNTVSTPTTVNNPPPKPQPDHDKHDDWDSWIRPDCWEGNEDNSGLLLGVSSGSTGSTSTASSWNRIHPIKSKGMQMRGGPPVNNQKGPKK